MKLHAPLNLLASGLVLAYAMPSQADYDTDMMRALGLPGELAEYFAAGVKFPAGKHRLEVVINGQSRGLHEVGIDGGGDWLYDADLAETLGLRACAIKQPHSLLFKHCYPEGRIEADTGNNQLELLMPQRYILRQPDEYQFGGQALMLNYTANRFDNQRYSSDYAALETGFNSHNWLFRHNGTYSKYGERKSYTPYNSYLQKTFTDKEAMLRLGRSTLTDSLYSGFTLDGLQWLPDSALSASRNSDVPPIEGIAESQAKVEVFQHGRLVYATVVQPGPFRLTDIPLQFDAVDLDVSVTESNGNRKRFTVPYLNAAMSQNAARSAYSLAIGRTRHDDKALETPFVTGSLFLPWHKNKQLRGGSFLSRHYQGAAAGYSLSDRRYRLAAQSQVSHTRQAKNGVKLQLNGALPLAKSVTLNGGYSVQSARYRDPAEALRHRKVDSFGQGPGERFHADDKPQRQRQSYSAGLGLHHALAGNLSLGVTRADYAQAGSSQRLYGYWNRQFDRWSLGIGVERERNNLSRDHDTRVYATLSLPLGKTLRYTANASNNGKYRSIGHTLSGQALDNDLSYGLNATQAGAASGNTYSGNLRYLSPFTTLAGGYSQMPDSQHAFYYGASGSLVADRSGLTLSPQQVGDTFGVLSAPGLSGTRVSTPGGTVKTYGKQGKAVIPQLRQYQPSLVKIDTGTLPAGADIDNGAHKMTLARGSVNHIKVNAINTLRVMARITYADGSLPALGSAVRDEQQRVAAFTDGQGNALIERQQAHNANDQTASQRFSMTAPSGRQCHFELSSATGPVNRAGIAQRSAVCREMAAGTHRRQE
ncbi:fimbria/pilus outer membrane usher protein [Serratia ficaria]|uniref:fimbria/pilus outer membrane usher protein n=1 Tax=Serratia ficaria TaxID=61651 RepID=UPI00217B98CF|nr:fimbria/pilus outer membrane usher protein [Serratia ficaria]CAI1084149.1 Outer membrane usher protein fimD precursor [Serratia ficaria]CAI1879236.1 Outer membrane usher protein fimD precursor [Serratia ficaria]CAI2493245.1 Outer membrane usher protein fimD precursor [Serratia ficaria]CAI2790235.1 Outer membrane usher protein fimD precursor [Serratia ficaria]